MSNPETLAKSARERLAQALSALQGDPATPQALLDLADPIAESMGILHRIERSKGADLNGRDAALAHVRTALNALQQMTFDHPALDMVMDQVAGCLSSVHQLARYQPPAGPAPAGPAAAGPAPAHAAPQAVHAAPQAAPAHDGAVTVSAPAGYAVAAAATAPVALGGTQVLSAPSPAAFPAPQPVPQPAPHHHQPVPQPAPQAAFQAPIPQPAPAPQPTAAPHQPAFSSPNQTVRLQPNAQQAAAQAAQAAHAAVQATAPAPYAQPAAPAAPAPAQQAAAPAAARAPLPSTPQASPSQSGNVVVELGTHSVSNFYKGLGGNDVIEHGGIFVATYKIPKMGAQVNLRVLLPGDYEFQAAGVVQWIREPHSGGDSSEPGFGARFVQITPEGRQLVYRYTRNREPMFYDDL
ncbi:MAG: hypothetical protein JNL21_29075 [Myxococcales bacterium]|nr:hypothetical protein [Myxococcales bacterium]